MKPRKRGDKDIANIEGIPINDGEGRDGRPAPVKQRKKVRKLNTLESDDDEESEEYKLSG